MENEKPLKVALLIPTYEPNGAVLPFLSNFKEGDFDYFLLVNDGSGAKYEETVREIAEKTVFEVIEYPKNHGKGYALKTGMKKIFADHPEIDVIITADDDGQHCYEDILRIRDVGKENLDALVIGVRDFSGDDVPARSRFGNQFSSGYFYLATGHRIRDTQTGLRSIPRNLYVLALKTPGKRYDYEMCFLRAAIHHFKVVQEPIKTIYIEDNAASHFRPMQDSLRIYRSPLIYFLIACGRFALEMVLFYVFSQLVFTSLGPMNNLLVGTLLATSISASIAFFLNLWLVFYEPYARFQSTFFHFLRLVIGFSIALLLNMIMVYLEFPVWPMYIWNSLWATAIVYAGSILVLAIKRKYIFSKKDLPGDR